jgi:hypothetical protein
MWIFLLCLCMLRATGQERIRGWVSDAACGAEHTKPGGEDCVKKCIRGGEQINPAWKAQKMILVSEDGGSILVVENPRALAGLEGKHVLVAAQTHPASVRIISARIIEESAK